MLSFSPNPLLWPLLRSGNKRQSTPSGAPAPAYPLCSQVLSERRPNTGILGLLLHRDNDNAHIADATLDSSEEDCVQLVSCPRIPRSQPLVNLCLFPHVKRQSSFSGSEMLEPSSRAWFRHQRGLTQWSRDLKSRPSACMPRGGYFEKENGAGKKSASASGNVWGHLPVAFKHTNPQQQKGGDCCSLSVPKLPLKQLYLRAGHLKRCCRPCRRCPACSCRRWWCCRRRRQCHARNSCSCPRRRATSVRRPVGTASASRPQNEAGSCSARR